MRKAPLQTSRLLIVAAIRRVKHMLKRTKHPHKSSRGLFWGTTLLSFIGVTSTALAQDEYPRYSDRLSVMTGLTQWILFGGGNLAAQFKWNRMVFEYSHGHALNLNRIEGLALSREQRDADIELRIPWTTGGGVGFQITPNLHLLVEIKAHRYEVRGANRNQQLKYTALTIGPGVFYDLYLYKGLFIQPSVRVWPTVASSFDENQAEFERPDGGAFRYEESDVDIIFNVNLGWTFTGI